MQYIQCLLLLLTLEFCSMNDDRIIQFTSTSKLLLFHRAMYAGVVLTFIIYIFLICILGYITYAYFADCDPLAAEAISARDQALPLLVQNVFSAYHGITGLFIAGVFAAALRYSCTGCDCTSPNLIPN